MTEMRNYDLLGPEAQLAEARGLVNANWYKTPVSRSDLKSLMQRRDAPAIRDTLIWLGLLAGSGTLAVLFWGTLWSVLPFAVYGTLYGSVSASRWHECSHGTAFRTTWLNEAVYHLASFLVIQEPYTWRWSHARHHTDTMIVGRDPEISPTRPPKLLNIVVNLIGIRRILPELGRILLHSTGRLTAVEATYIPRQEHAKVFIVARVYTLIFASVIASSVWYSSILPLMLIGLPSFYGAWLDTILGLTQHAGLAEDVLDHRLNSRTIYMPRVLRFCYWNMNYHIEHHMYPLVPYHALPALHQKVLFDQPAPYPSLIAAYLEIVPTLVRQRRDPSYFVEREVPRTLASSGGT